jgi:ABC-type glycerol-3-phosphate transport system substrate-binding protein
MRAVILAACLALTACSSGFDKARVTVTTAVKVEGDVEDSLLAAVQAKQKDLIAQVQAGKITVEQAQAQYDVWRAKVDKVIAAVTTLHDAMKTAAHAIYGSEALGNKDYTAVMGDMASAIASLVQALADAGIHIPGVS